MGLFDAFKGNNGTEQPAQETLHRKLAKARSDIMQNVARSEEKQWQIGRGAGLPDSEIAVLITQSSINRLSEGKRDNIAANNYQKLVRDNEPTVQRNNLKATLVQNNRRQK